MPNTSTQAATSAVPTASLLTPAKAWTVLLLVYIAVHFAALFSPSLLDDVDSTHALAAQHIVLSGDWVTLQPNGIRYLEKAPLPYWLAAVDYRIFGFNVFASHLPASLAVLATAVLGWLWARRAYGERAAFYSALALLTSVGIFLFTRFFIPEAILSFFLAAALYFFLTALEDRRPARFYFVYASLALAVLTKGLIAPVFFLAAVIPYLLLTGFWRRWREFRLFSGLLLFLAIAAPWHVLASLRNPDHGHPLGNIPSPGNVHGFFYFYFINEQVLRFLGRRFPHDYNKLPFYLYWPLHLVWLFPWSLFLPIALRQAWRKRRGWLSDLRPFTPQTVDFYIDRAHLQDPAAHAARLKFRARTSWLLALYAGFILIFFALSTNQEYYTYPAYFALLLLTVGALTSAEQSPRAPSNWFNWLHAVFAVVGIGSAAALGYGLWSSRSLPFVPDIGTLLAHRAVGGYSLSMSHFFDLTAPSFAALREPAAMAAIALFAGPLLAWILRRKGHPVEATTSIAFTSAIFLIAAHTAFGRFEPLLSSRAMADTIKRIELRESALEPGSESGSGLTASSRAQVLLYGDQSDGSSIPFYTNQQAYLVHNTVPGQCPGLSSMLWGSCYPDAPHIFLDDQALLQAWGTGPRKFLFVTGEYKAHVAALLGSRAQAVQELADKTLYTDRALR
ncbi:MAG TPA: glycosyltransferase family 39 protein [Acidisarcina sp.]